MLWEHDTDKGVKLKQVRTEVMNGAVTEERQR